MRDEDSLNESTAPTEAIPSLTAEELAAFAEAMVQDCDRAKPDQQPESPLGDQLDAIQSPSAGALSDQLDAIPTPSTTALSEQLESIKTPLTSGLSEQLDAIPTPSIGGLSEQLDAIPTPSTSGLSDQLDAVQSPSTNALSEQLDASPTPSIGALSEQFESIPTPGGSLLSQQLDSIPTPRKVITASENAVTSPSGTEGYAQLMRSSQRLKAADTEPEAESSRPPTKPFAIAAAAAGLLLLFAVGTFLSSGNASRNAEAEDNAAAKSFARLVADEQSVVRKQQAGFRSAPNGN